jgi:voltage-gated potassium channel
MESRSNRTHAGSDIAPGVSAFTHRKMIDDKRHSVWRRQLNAIIFRNDLAAGQAFDIVVIASITLSVTALVLESIPSIGSRYGSELHTVEWFFTILFTIEYFMRLLAARDAALYARSFFGVVDLLAILPVYLGLVFPASHYLMVIRVLRLLRVFRIFHLAHYLDEANYLIAAICASYYKIIVFIFTVITIVIVLGSLIYSVEGEANGFTSIWSGVYWAIGTLTTTDVSQLTPRTVVGQVLATIVMILGYGVIAVPTGIVTVEMTSAIRRSQSRSCSACGADRLDNDASYCKYCGSSLTSAPSPQPSPRGRGSKERVVD